MGTLIIVFVFGVLLILVFLLLKCFKDRFKAINKIHDQIKKTMIWNSPLRFILESYIPTTLIAFSTIKTSIGW